MISKYVPKIKVVKKNKKNKTFPLCIYLHHVFIVEVLCHGFDNYVKEKLGMLSEEYKAAVIPGTIILHFRKYASSKLHIACCIPTHVDNKYGRINIPTASAKL